MSRRGLDDFSGEGRATVADIEGVCHRSSKPVKGDERTEDGRMEESSEKDKAHGGSME